MRRFGKKETKIFEMLHLTHLGRFHKGDEVGTAIEVRQGDSICLNAAFHTLWSCLTLGRTTQILASSLYVLTPINLVVGPIVARV